jgi:hypothetical protein
MSYNEFLLVAFPQEIYSSTSSSSSSTSSSAGNYPKRKATLEKPKQHPKIFTSLMIDYLEATDKHEPLQKLKQYLDEGRRD